MSLAFAASLLGKQTSSREAARALGYDKGIGSGPVSMVHGIGWLVRKGFQVTCVSQPGSKLPPYRSWLAPNASVDMGDVVRVLPQRGSARALKAMADEFSEGRLASAQRLFEKGGPLAGPAYRDERRKMTAHYLTDMLRCDRPTVAIASIWLGHATSHTVALAGCGRSQKGTYQVGMYSTDGLPWRTHEPLEELAGHIRQERKDIIFIS